MPDYVGLVPKRYPLALAAVPTWYPRCEVGPRVVEQLPPADKSAHVLKVRGVWLKPGRALAEPTVGDRFALRRHASSVCAQLVKLVADELRGYARNGLVCLVGHALENADQRLGERDPYSTVHLGLRSLVSGLLPLFSVSMTTDGRKRPRSLAAFYGPRLAPVHLVCPFCQRVETGDLLRESGAGFGRSGPLVGRVADRRKCRVVSSGKPGCGVGW
jgi:hypothetical protein